MRRFATALCALGFFWGFAATVFILTGAGLQGIRTTFTLAAAAGEVGRASVPLLSASGVWTAGLLLGVTLLAGMPLGVAVTYPEGQRTTTWSAGVLLIGFSLTAGLTVGLFYLPSAVVLLAAATATGSVRTERLRETSGTPGAV